MTDKAEGPGGSELIGSVRPGEEAHWCVVEADTGITVAKGYAPTEEDAVREAGHYAVQYAQDGPVRWWVRVGRKTVLRASLDGLTITASTAKA